VLELAMAASRGDQMPPVAPQDLQHFAHLHCPNIPLGIETVGSKKS